jgi:hypothetical protein
MLGSADDDKCNAITVANNKELWFDTDAANFSHSNCSQKLFFSNFCMVWSKLKPFELSFSANSDSSTYSKISQTGFQMASQPAIWVYYHVPTFWQINTLWFVSLNTEGL